MSCQGRSGPTSTGRSLGIDIGRAIGCYDGLLMRGRGLSAKGIPGSFIVQSEVNPRARKILPKLVEIIHDLGAQVVCEGIETKGQHELAVSVGVDLVQGFYYAIPHLNLLRECRALKPVAPLCPTTSIKNGSPRRFNFSASPCRKAARRSKDCQQQLSIVCRPLPPLHLSFLSMQPITIKAH